VVFDGTVNILGCTIEVKSKHFPTVFKKNNGKTGIFTQNQFSTKSFFYMVIFQKLIIVNT
ncbi:hypothetical protein FWK35_00015314, partial [Aphis craccivora]